MNYVDIFEEFWNSDFLFTDEGNEQTQNLILLAHNHPCQVYIHMILGMIYMD